MAAGTRSAGQKRTVAFSRDQTNVFFHILTACNLRCRHCYIDPAQHGDRTLDAATVGQWLQLFAGPGKSPNLVLLGGEPTLHPDLADIIRRARTSGYASITVDTNGYLFHDILDRVGPAEVDFFSFSLDGASQAVNDAIRGEGCFRHCTAGIRRAVKKGFGVSVIFTVSSINRHELADMAPLLEDLGVNRFFIQVIGLRGASAKDAQADSLQVSRDQWLETVPPVAADIAARGITVSYPKVFLEEEEVFACAGLVADNYFVFPNGRVYRCPLCEDFPLHSLEIAGGRLVPRPPINEKDLFALTIPEGCVMNRLVQPGNLSYRPDGRPAWRIACCLLKEELPGRDVLK